jgi:ABC-type sugar transport system permease subunit
MAGRAVRARHQGQGRVAKSRILMGYLFILPAFFFFVVFKFGAVAYLVPLSLVDWRLGSTRRVFVGLGNYQKLLVAPGVLERPGQYGDLRWPSACSASCWG